MQADLLKQYFTSAELTALARQQHDLKVEVIRSEDPSEDEEVREGRKIRHFLNQNKEQEEPLWVLDITAVVRQMLKWRMHLPNVRPFYAVKCNNYGPLIDILRSMGAGFDCASRAEIEQVMCQGSPSTDVIYANPCKQVSHMQAARASGVSWTTVDNDSELSKFHKHWPDAQILIRIATDDSAAKCQFSTKFGATLATAQELVKSMRALGLNLVGVSFHVGSLSGCAQAHAKAARAAYEVFKMGRAAGFDMQVLDIGGGFPGQDAELAFEDIAHALKPVLEELFADTTIIAEPGRFFAATSHTLAANIFSKRLVGGTTAATDNDIEPDTPPTPVVTDTAEYQYYLNDGVYQSFNCLFFDHVDLKPYLLPWGREEALACIGTSETDSSHGSELSTTKITTIYGPTCDSLDRIAKRVPFPEMFVGDWVYFANMGAYTRVAASPFNGFFSWRNCHSSDTDFAAIAS